MRIIARLDVKGPNLIKSINLEGLRGWEIRMILPKNIIEKVLMN